MSLDVYLEIDCDTGGESHTAELYHANITHNLGPMAKAAGIYMELWRPEELGVIYAGELVEPLTAGLEKLEAEPEEFRKHNPPNGWGTYEGFVLFVREYLYACRKYPKANVRVWR